MDKDFPSLNTRNSTYKLTQRSKTSNMPMFLELVKLDVTLNHGYKLLMEERKWLFRLNKHYCLGSLSMVSDFVEYLQNEWKIEYSGIIGYMNALGHLLDFQRKFSNSVSENVSVFLASEILQRVKRFLSRKMKL